MSKCAQICILPIESPPKYDLNKRRKVTGIEIVKCVTIISVITSRAWKIVFRLKSENKIIITVIEGSVANLNYISDFNLT